ncbi:ribonuclease HI [Natranaerobius thermophilus]|uniref:Ribonuclease H n=1 Tax=Natranaerobius thermophilus (strain ATCC BAA-1301 / DSM 18059 / JW/NM-WN-LF) TaxID=457570 RepID=B2A1L5_NATTJ|nr:ribonuclease HI [Natranaerobius thermophilus]ACB84755.1 RNase HI [Natranaerobius thermophilus JW/NM-WN-LF]
MTNTNEDKKRVTIYTDGACSGNPGPGGWGAILLFNEHKKELSGSAENTTNQRMELYAAVQALKALKYPCNVELCSDSAYLVNCFQQGWWKKWQRNNWLTKSKKKVDNQDLWRELIELNDYHSIQWIKVKGHSDDELNNRADQLATEAIPDKS